MAQPRIGRRLVEEKQTIELKESVELSPEDAAEVLLEYLPTDVQMAVREASDNMKLPLWQVILGYTIKVAERFELFSPIILSSWETGSRPNLPRPCGTCGVEFTSRYPDAKFCCSHCFFGHLDKSGHTKDCYIPKS